MIRRTKQFDRFIDDLFRAEFIDKNYNKYISLLRRALKWKTHNNLIFVCEYLGAETDKRTETVEGCKEIIKEDIEFYKDKMKGEF